MKIYILLATVLFVAFTGCSAKEINAGVDSMTSDISKAFEEGRDKSAD